jgi:hypothetical protein
MSGASDTRSGCCAISNARSGELRTSSRCEAASRSPDMVCAGGFASWLCLVRLTLSMPAT